MDIEIGIIAIGAIWILFFLISQITLIGKKPIELEEIKKNDNLWIQLGFKDYLLNHGFMDDIINIISTVYDMHKNTVIRFIDNYQGITYKAFMDQIWSLYLDRDKFITAIFDNGYKVSDIGYVNIDYIHKWIQILEQLPHGSGVDCDYYITVKDNKLHCSNSYHIMINGYYHSYMDYTAIYDNKGKLETIDYDNGSIEYDNIEQIAIDNNVDPNNESDMEGLLSNSDVLDESYIDCLIDSLYQIYTSETPITVLDHIKELGLKESIYYVDPDNIGSDNTLYYGDLTHIIGDLTDKRESNNQIGIFVSDILAGSDYGGCSVTKSNYEVMLEEFKDCPDIFRVYGSYGSYGIGIRIDSINRDIMDRLTQLRDYPLLDEEHLFNLESEGQKESWNDYGFQDILGSIIKTLTEKGTEIDLDYRDIEQQIIDNLLIAYLRETNGPINEEGDTWYFPDEKLEGLIDRITWDKDSDNIITGIRSVKTDFS